MKKGAPRSVLMHEWACYLAQREHEIKPCTSDPDVLLSRNNAGPRYRWLFAQSDGNSLRLTAADHEHIERQARHARRKGERPYLVVKFERPQPKVVVLPATAAARARVLSAHQGGIPWDR